ncbi:MAG: MBL fold metallo-hydrolase [Verrucomicrobia bacterium]|nr:MBL fold metallo-hydrolase [Verrucomicrobiota bacterium]
MKIQLLLVTLIAALSTTARAQQDFAKVEIKATQVSKNVYMLEGAGGNIGVSVGADGILIVDDQFAPLAAKIEAALQKLDPGKLKFVLNTHWHGDHTGGNAHFGRDASIVAHTNVRKRLLADNATKREALPVITFDDTLSVHFNGEEIKVMHLPPGHTDGDSVIFFTGANVVHLGDQFFAGKFPFIDANSGGDVAGYMRNVGEMLKLIPADAKIIPGHGPLATAEDLKRFYAMLAETTGIVQKAIAAGKTFDQVKADGLPEKWKDWGTGFINTGRWLEICFNSLSKK